MVQARGSRSRVAVVGTAAAGAALALHAGCTDGLFQRDITVRFTVDGRDAQGACADQGATRVVARARWASGDRVETKENGAPCKDGEVRVSMGGSGTIQLTTYDGEGSDATVMGISQRTSVDLSGAALPGDSVNVDITPLRGTLKVTITCMGQSCADQLHMDGAEAPSMAVLTDTNGRDLELVHTVKPVMKDGTLQATTNRARVDATNVVRVTAQTHPSGERVAGEVAVRLAGLQDATVMVDLQPVATRYDAGFHRVDGGAVSGTASSVGASSVAGSAGSSASRASSAAGGSSAASGGGSATSAPAPSSGSAGSGLASSAAAGSSAAGSSASVASSAAPASSATPASSAAVASSSEASSSAAASSSGPAASSAGASSSAAASSAAESSSSTASSG